MLLPYLNILNDKVVILGSQSKMRNQLMKTQKLKYQTVSSTFAEDLDKKSFPNPESYNLQTCRGKCEQLISRFEKQNKKWDLLICGDTIVYHNEQIIQKPHCVKMMSGLANKTHQVYTANMIVFNQNPLLKFEYVSKGDVTFGQIPIESIQGYARTDEPYSHSGGYQLTAQPCSFIQKISGNMTSIQGLDMYYVCSKIIEGSKKLGWIN